MEFTLFFVYWQLSEINTSWKQDQTDTNLLVALLVTTNDFVGFSIQKKIFS